MMMGEVLRRLLAETLPDWGIHSDLYVADVVRRFNEECNVALGISDRS